MKHLAIIIIAAAALAFPLGAAAQENIERALDAFKRAKGVYIPISKTQNGNDQGKECTFECYEFDVKKDNSQWKQLLKAFDVDAEEAYSVYDKKKGKTDRARAIVGYGPDPANTSVRVSFGAYTDRNYRVMMFRDPDDMYWRTCYALVWFDNADNSKNYHGLAYKIYSRDPQRSSEEQEEKTVTMLSDGSMMQYDKATGKTTIVQGVDKDTYYDRITSSIDFLSRFNNLRTLFIKYNTPNKTDVDNLSVLTGIVNKIMALCKKNGKMLNSDERRVVTDMLGKMQQDCEDIGLSSMLGLAAKYLK